MMTPQEVYPGELITVEWQVVGNQTWEKDYLGLYNVTASNNAYVTYRYTSGKTKGTISFAAPNTPGKYEIRYLVNNGYVDVAVTEPVVVVAR